MISLMIYWWELLTTNHKVLGLYSYLEVKISPHVTDSSPQKNMYKNNNSGCNGLLKERACHQMVGFMYPCPQTEMSNHPASLEETSGQHAVSLSCCWLSRPELPLQVYNYPNSSRCRVDTDTIHRPKEHYIKTANYTQNWNIHIISLFIIVIFNFI